MFCVQSLGCNYDNSIHKRMSDRHERRTQYSEINTRATQRFGTLCSPYQALQLLVSAVAIHCNKDLLLSHFQNFSARNEIHLLDSGGKIFFPSKQ